MKFGYVRVSTQEQNTVRQEVLMQELGVDKVYIDKISGKNMERPELKKLLEYVRDGDTVIVESISRFARNTREFLLMINLLKEKQVEFISKKENIDTSTPAGKFMLTVFAAIAELERDYLLQRQAEGIAIAKQEGRYRGRKKIDPDSKKLESVYLEWKAKKIPAVKAMAKLKLSKNTFYRRMREYEGSVKINEFS